MLVSYLFSSLGSLGRSSFRELDGRVLALPDLDIVLQGGPERSSHRTLITWHEELKLAIRPLADVRHHSCAMSQGDRLGNGRDDSVVGIRLCFHVLIGLLKYVLDVAAHLIDVLGFLFSKFF